jgi:pyrophosphatase PpaX
MSWRFHDIQALVFDFDGTLVDASIPICRAFNAALEGYGADSIEENEIRKLIGRPLAEMFPRVLPDLTEIEIERLITDYRAVFNPIATQLSRPIPGLMEMLHHFHPSMRLGIATSRISDGAHRILEAMGVRQCFEVIVGLADVSQPKPHPEPVLKVLDQLKVSPVHAIMIGDIPADIEAGRAAGAATIGVASDLYPEAALLDAGADAVIHSLAEMIELIESR